MAKVVQPHGGALNAGGTPGNAGGTGRPPNWLKDFCDELLHDPKTQAAAKRILAKPSVLFPAMWKAVADRAHGKPTETKDVNLNHRILITNDILAEPPK